MSQQKLEYGAETELDELSTDAAVGETVENLAFGPGHRRFLDADGYFCEATLKAFSRR